MFIKLLRKYIYRRSFARTYAAMRGLTLVELMIYLAILSLLSVGIMQMILEVQTSNITLLSHADNYAKGDLALRRVQVKLGSSDDVEVVSVPGSPLDKACLRLKSYQQYERTGYRFDGRNRFLRTSSTPSDHFGMLGASPRTISAWVRVDPDIAGRGTVVMWGNGQKSQFGLDVRIVRQGKKMVAAPVVNFNCASMQPQLSTDLRDGTWHHIAVTFSASGTGRATAGTIKMYIDGVAVPLNFVDCLTRPGDVISTTRSPLYIGRDLADRQSGFKGVISDLRIWQRTLAAPELCAISGIPALATSNCRVTTAFIAIDDYVPGLHGELDMQFVSWQTSGFVKSASNLPNMPSNVTATWYPRIGVMKFSSPLPLETRLWNRVISQTLYRPKGHSQISDSPQSSDATITFRFGVGGLPFFEGGNYFMHEFVETSPPLAFDNATVAAQTSTGSLCGMRSYLAAITSEAEQDHLEDVMISGSGGGWQSGWIAGVIKQGQTFEWVSPPQTSAMPIWQGTGVAGHPYDLVTGQRAPANAATSFEFDQKPGITGHRKRMLIRREGAHSTRYRYTNWMGGTDTVSCDSRSGVSAAIRGQLCEPLMTANGTAIAIHGHMNRDGTWVSMPGGTTSCDSTQNHSVCGYYREFDTVGLPAGTVLGEKLTINMERFREFCKGS